MPSFHFPLQLLLATALCAMTREAQAEAPPHVIAAIAQHAAFVQAELRFARVDGHRERVRCLNLKLSEIHAQQRLAHDRARKLGSAVDRGDEREAARSRAILIRLRQRAGVLSRQAQSCGRSGRLPQSGYRVRVIAAR
jgi:hypothetical protein